MDLKQLPLSNTIFILLVVQVLSLRAQESLKLNEKEYFHTRGLDVMAFSDSYPEGRQSGVIIIQHGVRVAANGDLRLEPSPGPWSPVPKEGSRIVDYENQRITQTLWFPDSSKNGRGFNPIEYPRLRFSYQVHVSALPGNSVKVTVDLDKPLPKEWIGKIGFNLELFPGNLHGKSFLMDQHSGIFPHHPAGEMTFEKGELILEPLGRGRDLVIAPEDEFRKISIRSNRSKLELWDGRTNDSKGWYIVRSTLPVNITKGAIEWIITPHTVYGWEYEPVIQVSQLGYHPDQIKVALVELDKIAAPEKQFTLYQVRKGGREMLLTGAPRKFGSFLRYQYLSLDFSGVNEQGIYQIAYGDQLSDPFRIATDVYGNSAWQTTLDYFLPVQMCHMRISGKYRVWHDLCHMDDALMAPQVPYHFNGYSQGADNYTKFEAGKLIPGLNQGGWHNGEDHDLRVEFQAGTVWMLALMIEEFGLDRDANLIDQQTKLVEIHQPDSINDALQQIEHGLTSILGGYKAMGSLYRGIICSDRQRFHMLGDAASMTDNIQGNSDDRWVFTENNPARELEVIPGLAAASRVLGDHNPELSQESLKTALALWEHASANQGFISLKVAALSELILATHDSILQATLVHMENDIIREIHKCGWAVGHVITSIENKEFREHMAKAVEAYHQKLQVELNRESPYGVPNMLNVRGDGWNILNFGVEQYFFHKGWPELTSSLFYENALHYFLGVHPGPISASFVSGVGPKINKTVHEANRAGHVLIPGEVLSGVSLIRPDLPDLDTRPLLWQQKGYMMGGGATSYVFLVMAVNSLYN